MEKNVEKEEGGRRKENLRKKKKRIESEKANRTIKPNSNDLDLSLSIGMF